MNLIRFHFLVCLACILAGCDRSKPGPAIPDKKSSFQQQVFTEPTSNSTIRLVSETECEIGTGRDIRLAEYSRQENKLRMVVRGAGVPLVIYYQIVQEGLRPPDSNKTYLSSDALTRFREEVRVAERKRRDEIRFAYESRLAAFRLTKETAMKTATKDKPLINSLGMKFVPVPITGGPTDGQRILFCVWSTRVQDYDVFARETGREVIKPVFEQGPTHPVVYVNLDDARAFCAWLSKEEGMSYRLPSDHEWSCAVGIGGDETASLSPQKKNQKAGGYPWGADPVPPKGAGNLPPYFAVDEFTETSPVGSFEPNTLGLYDLTGNVAQWVDTEYDPTDTSSPPHWPLRGMSWKQPSGYAACLGSSLRFGANPALRTDDFGFRVVVVGR